MALKKITVEFDEKFLPLIAMKNKEVPEKIREFVVLELYRRKEISSGKAAELLNMERFEFINYASRLGIPFLDMDEADLKRDIETTKKILKG
jgi:predicted HTH domain antitoxin